MRGTSPYGLYSRSMQSMLAEAIGTMMLVLLGNGVVANVVLNRTKITCARSAMKRELNGCTTFGPSISVGIKNIHAH